MQLGLRRLLYSTFILLFLVAAPLIILYASGYRYNFKAHRLQKTGLLIIETKPKAAKIYLNNQLNKNTTPAELKNLLPDEYLIKLEKDGYYPWTKKLKIASNLTTFANNIILFKKGLPILKQPGLIIWAKQAPNQNKLIYLELTDNNYQIKLFDLQNQEEKIIFETMANSQILPLSWSPNNKKLLVSVGYNSYLIINTETKSTQNLTATTAINFEKIRWDEKNNNILYGLKKNTLYQIDLLNNKTLPVLSSYINDFLPRGQNLYYLTKTNQGAFLNRQILGADSPPSVIKLPLFSAYEFKTGPEHLLTVFDAKNNELLIINADIFDQSDDQPKNIQLQLKAKKIVWSKNFKKAIIYNDFEIYNYDAESNNNHLITRLSQEIKNACWLPDAGYIFYTTDETLNVIELGFEIIKNSYQLANATYMGNDLFLDQKGERIYFTGRIGNQEGIFELEIN